MPIIWRLPTWNLTCNIWHNALPASLSGLSAWTPPLTPDVVAPCQLYFPRYGTGLYTHVLPDSVRSSITRSGYMELRCPKETDIRSPWVVTDASTWAEIDVVEVPAGTGRYYAVTFTDEAHYGFPNHYKTALLAKLIFLGDTHYAGGGGAASATVSPLAIVGQAGGGGAARALVVPINEPASAAGGGAAAALFTPPAIGGQAGGGGAARATASPPEVAGRAAGGGAARVSVVPIEWVALGAGGGAARATFQPPSISPQAAGGGAASAVVSSGGGTITPGSTCAGAAATTLPLSFTGAIAGGAENWFSFPIVSGTTYHVRITLNSGFSVTAQLGTGSCPTPSVFINVSATTTNCNDAVSGVTGTGLLRVFSSFGAINYTIQVGTGVC